jgi:hypothetical protein
VGGDGAQYASDLGFLKIRKFLRKGLDTPFGDLPVGQSKLPVGQQIVGWIEPFAKLIEVVQNMMGVALLYPSYGYALESSY